MLLLYRGSTAASRERGAGKIAKRKKGERAGDTGVKGMSMITMSVRFSIKNDLN